MIQYLIILSITDSVVVFDRFIAQVSLREFRSQYIVQIKPVGNWDSVQEPATSEKFENTSTLIRRENGAFRFRVDGNILKIEPFWRPENHLIPLPRRFFSNTFPKWPVISVDAKQFVRFQIE